MQLNSIRTIAKAQGITTQKLDKPALIRAIQRQEGNFDCFGSAASGVCDQAACLWRGDCLPTPSASPRKKPTAL
ncbi:MAG TPA: SAP domain-containing protein [Gammaproteobacteria bacterium]